MERPNAWKKYVDEAEQKKVMDFAEGYRQFISNCKTERECTAYFIEEAKKVGFKDLDECIAKGETLSPGDKVYRSNFGKALAAFVIGEEPLQKGIDILGAHIDSPRMDLKQNPLYEDADMVLLDTHYYGGIKKYQWVTLPLALHGVVVKKDGTRIAVAIGDKPGDPVFGVSDLLIHLAQTQMEKKAAKAVEGEQLDVLVGSIPFIEEGEKEPKKKKELVKKNILRILKETYDIEEEDFLSAEIEVVPAGEARDYGFDRSMIMGYGHDDRVCAYPSFWALADAKPGKKTLAALLVDKEEIGSVGATGMQSRFFENTVAELVAMTGDYSELFVRRALANSKALSSDVSAAFDALYADVSDKKN
ncbi:MAG: aminopeptidase, partial [Lachnospiraceae bacterium]|nr:aminopeptidase [Lachnospiraceae bacterium]